MKSPYIATVLLTAMTGAFVYYPSAPAAVPATPPAVIPVAPPAPVTTVSQRQRIEAVFVLDTTGSMGGLIDAAKDKIWSIASTLAQGDPAPELKIGLVAYRDRGDAYVTHITDLSGDLDTLYGTLMDYRAQGGGDTPESVNRALHDAINGVSWSQGADTYRVVFLLGDAPPHMDYQDEQSYPQTLALARERGIVVNAIQCGDYDRTRAPWMQIAQLGAGQYFKVAQDGGAIAFSTPFDDRLAGLSSRLDNTRLYYGDREARARQHLKLAATSKLHAEASLASQARRAVFNAAPGGADSFLGEGELVADVSSGRVDLDAVDTEQLPEPLRAMAPAERATLVETKARERAVLKQEIRELSRQRDDYLQKKVEETGTADDSLDHKLFDAVKTQALEAGIDYAAEAPAY